MHKIDGLSVSIRASELKLTLNERERESTDVERERERVQAGITAKWPEYEGNITWRVADGFELSLNSDVSECEL